MIWTLMLTAALFAQDDTTKQELEELKKRVEKLEKREGSEVEVLFKEGLRIRSKDGNLQMHIGGRLLEHLRIVEDTPDTPAAAATFPRETGFLLRQARLEMSGTLYRDWEFKVQADWGQGAAVLQDGYVGWKGLKEFAIRLGQFKEPFSGLDEMTSTRFIPMAERVTGNRLVPARDVGVQFWGRLFDDVLGYQIAVFNGSGQNPGAGADVNDEKDVAARLTLRPIGEGDFKNLHLGVAATFGDNDDPVLGDVRTRQTETRVIDMDGTTVIDDARERLGFELQIPYRNFGLEAEWYRVSMDLRDGAVEEEIDFDQWYVTVLWVVTGESKKFDDRLRPEKPFNLKEGTWGALELAARFARFEVDEEIVDLGFALAPTTTTRTDEFTIGFNWWPVANVRITANYIRNEYEDELSGIDDENAALIRFQADL